MKNTNALLLSMATFAIGAALCNVALSNSQNMKIAVVDINAVVQKSAQVAVLKKEQQAKRDELQKWLKTARANVNSQQTKEGKEKLTKKYNADFEKKREEINKNYQTKLKAIDANITSTIATEARTRGYDMVISKSVVIYGGNDITDAIQKVVK